MPPPAGIAQRMLACLAMSDLTLAERMVLASVAYFDGPQGAFPSQARIGEMLGMSPRTVRHHMANLVSKGALKARKRQRTSRYTVVYEASDRQESCQSDSDRQLSGQSESSDRQLYRRQTGNSLASDHEENRKQHLPPGKVIASGKATHERARRAAADPGGPPPPALNASATQKDNGTDPERAPMPDHVRSHMQTLGILKPPKPTRTRQDTEQLLAEAKARYPAPKPETE